MWVRNGQHKPLTPKGIVLRTPKLLPADQLHECGLAARKRGSNSRASASVTSSAKR